MRNPYALTKKKVYLITQKPKADLERIYLNLAKLYLLGDYFILGDNLWVDMVRLPVTLF